MYAAIDLALDGEMRQGRLVPSYSNIALMYGALWDFEATHNHNADWQKRSAEWIDEVTSLFHQFNSFNEYNSPTYYGVDLFGLALWRCYGSTAHIREAGSEIETVLWNDIADFYHPGLRNVAGPYDRSYGMDMESYVALVGVWIRTVLPASQAPLPVPANDTDHLADLWFAPQFTILEAKPSVTALAKIRHFQGEHLVTRRITPDRTATAWIGDKVIFGGELTSLTKDAPVDTQFHPGTAQWRTPSGPVGWFYVMKSPPIDVHASRSGLEIKSHGDVVIRVHAANVDSKIISATRWTLPGLAVDIQADQKSFTVTSAPIKDTVDITYTGINSIILNVKPE
jgi:hypothetical protein